MVGDRRNMVLMYVAILILLLGFGCRGEDKSLRFDGEYSDQLTVLASSRSSQEIADSVDLLRVYKVPKRRFAFFASPFSHQDLILETRDRQVIRDLIGAVAEQVHDVSQCKLQWDQPVLHVLAYDPTRKRIGYFRVVRCSTDHEVVGAIINLRKSALYYNRAFLQALRAHTS